MRALKSGLIYFAIVFAAGLALGPIRILWAVPRFGERVSELAELPLMAAVIVLAARWIARRPAAPASAGGRLAAGLIALALMIGAELGAVLPLRGLTLGGYLARRDPVSGAGYLAGLALLALMPALVRRGARDVRETAGGRSSPR